MIGLDTTVLIELLRGNIAVTDIPKDESFCTTGINLFELEVGLRNHETALFQQITNSVIVLPFDAKSSHKSSEILKKLKKSGKEVGKFDCMIAGCLQAHNVHTIMTHNKKHFANISGLKVLSV